MNFNKSKIDLIGYYDKALRVQLDDSFKLQFLRKLGKKYTPKQLIILTGIHKDSIKKYCQGKLNFKFDCLLKLFKLLDIPKQELIDNIKFVYLKFKNGAFNLKELQLTSEFAEWYGMWRGDGDHSPKREAISLTNYSVELLKFHIEMLSIFGFEKERISVEIISPSKESKYKIKERWSKILNLPLNQMSCVTYMSNATQEGARVQVWCAGLFRILHQIDNEIKSIIKRFDKEVKIAYIKGIFAAEGNIRKSRKTIRSNMKDENEMLFAKSLLKDLQIQSRLAKNIANDCYELSITGFENIKKFKIMKGFGLQKEKSKVLNTYLESYENKVPYSKRFDRIEKVLLKRKEISNDELAEIFKRHSRHIAWVTKHFTDKGLLKVDKSNKTYKYSLIDSSS